MGLPVNNPHSLNYPHKSKMFPLKKTSPLAMRASSASHAFPSRVAGGGYGTAVISVSAS